MRALSPSPPSDWGRCLGAVHAVVARMNCDRAERDLSSGFFAAGFLSNAEDFRNSNTADGKMQKQTHSTRIGTSRKTPAEACAIWEKCKNKPTRRSGEWIA